MKYYKFIAPEVFVLCALLGLAACSDDDGFESSINVPSTDTGLSQDANSSSDVESSRDVQPSGDVAPSTVPDTGVDADADLVPTPCMVTTVDRGNDGTITSRIIGLYDEDGNVIRTEGDTDMDGTVDYFHDYEYDSLGRKLLEIEDNDTSDDGLYLRRTWSYEEEDERLVRIHEQFDFDADDAVDRQRFDYFDTEGLRTRRDGDTDLDEVPDYRYEFDYDANGRLIEQRYDDGIDGALEVRSVWTHEVEQGRLIRSVEEEDVDDDGDIDVRITEHFDAEGNRIKHEADREPDGVIDMRHEYEFDDQGREIADYLDLQADGAVDQTTRYDYDAVCDR